MTGISKRHRDTRGECHVMREAEIGGLQLKAENTKGLQPQKEEVRKDSLTGSRGSMPC